MKKIMIFSAPIVIGLALWLGHAVWEAEQAAEYMAQFEKIHGAKTPLTTTQVEQIMGPPLRIEQSESTGIVGEVYHYATYPPGGDFQVIFVNRVVFGTAIPRYTPKS